jgi:hypothetical protein
VGLVVTWGWLLRKTTTLNEVSGLRIGEPFAGAASDIPTSTQWKDGSYWGASLDPRIAGKLVRATPGFGKS